MMNFSTKFLVCSSMFGIGLLTASPAIAQPGARAEMVGVPGPGWNCTHPIQSQGANARQLCQQWTHISSISSIGRIPEMPGMPNMQGMGGMAGMQGMGGMAGMQGMGGMGMGGMQGMGMGGMQGMGGMAQQPEKSWWQRLWPFN